MNDEVRSYLTAADRAGAEEFFRDIPADAVAVIPAGAEAAVSFDPETAKRVAIARAYLDSQPEVLVAIRARREHMALLTHVSTDVRDHYTAAIVQATRSVLDVELALVRAELAAMIALWAAE
jgi:hypothetical protein